MTKFTTLQQARRETIANDKVCIRHDERIASEAAIRNALLANPQIGMLNSGKFYVFSPNGDMIVADHPAKLI